MKLNVLQCSKVGEVSVISRSRLPILSRVGDNQLIETRNEASGFLVLIST